MKSAVVDPELPATPEREMLIELVGLHARALLRMPWVQTCLVFGIGLVIFSYVNPLIFFGWGALTIGVETLRARYAAGVLRRGCDIDPKRVHAAFVGLAALAGAAIAVGAVIFMPELPILHQALFGAILLAIPAAGVAVSQSSRYVLGAYAITILLPASTTWGLLHPSQFLGVVALTSLLWVVLILVAADGDKLLLRSVTIRHERDRLVFDLEQRNADVRAAMAQAQQSAQARARVLAAASHDLRQPLHALSVYSAVLAAHPAPDTLNEVSQNIDQIVRSLGSLLNGLLDLSRLSAGYYVPERQNLALQRLVGDVCGEYERPAAQKGLSLKQDLSPIRLLGDPVAIGRIVRNLVDNAIKYTELGEVRVAMHLEYPDQQPVAVLSVTDTGKGIPAAEQSRVFEEFYQLDNPGRDRSRGVGLGLAIVQRLCELIGATVSVESGVGNGTCFSVRMPAILAESAAPEGIPASTADASLQGKRVYVVDDELDILKSMSTLLTVWGIGVNTAESTRAADRIFEQHGPPDLMIVDLRLGEDEHGARLADRLQQKYGNFPVLITTGETSSEALRQANERSYTLLQKPIAPEVLRRAIVVAVIAVADLEQSVASLPEAPLEGAAVERSDVVG
jgi:signal transduction histidine kinase/ActR/RegA family two-component response regulator